MFGRNLIVVTAMTMLWSLAPAAAHHGAPASDGKSGHSACPHRRVAEAAKWSGAPASAATAVQVSAGGSAPLNLRRFAPELLP